MSRQTRKQTTKLVQQVDISSPYHWACSEVSWILPVTIVLLCATGSNTAQINPYEFSWLQDASQPEGH